MDYAKEALKLHKEKKGKLEVASKVPVKTKDDLSIAYTPGVAQPCLEIAKNPDDVYTYTAKGNMVAVLTDGSAVLGLGNIGASASLPVMEGKCVLFKEFAGVDAFPIAVDSQDTDEIVKTAKLISPMFGGINLEDIAAPRCFEVEDQLKEILDIPIFHDDQHGTAIVVLAGLLNSLKLADKQIDKVRIVMMGAGAAGIAVTKLLLKAGARHITLLDSKGAIYEGREEGMNPAKEDISKITNQEKEKGLIQDVIKGKDIFIGVSIKDLLTADDIKNMNEKPIIFAMSNPDPEIQPSIAKQAGAFIVATGRSDHPNQINNVLAFPGVFRGALDVRAKEVNEEMKLDAAHALAGMVDPSPDKIVPAPFDKGVADAVAEAVRKAAIRTGVAMQ